MTFNDVIKKQKRALLDKQGVTVRIVRGTASTSIETTTVIFYPLSDKDSTSGARRSTDLTRGIIYPSEVLLDRGDKLVKSDGTAWAVLPLDTLTKEGDSEDGLKKARVVFKGVVND